jgi:putative ABC transport system permease protein
VANGRNWSTSVIGSSNAWFDTGNWKLASGRIFEPDEQLAGAAVCLIGETVRCEIFDGTAGQNGLGEQLRVRKFSCTVIGILAANGQNGMGDQDDIVVVPRGCIRSRRCGTSEVYWLPGVCCFAVASYTGLGTLQDKHCAVTQKTI